MATDTSAAIRSRFADDPDMADLIQEFVGELASRADALSADLRAGRTDDLRRRAHQLRGAAAGYGFPEISGAAGALEDCLRQGAPVGDQRVATLASSLESLCRRATAD